MTTTTTTVPTQGSVSLTGSAKTVYALLSPLRPNLSHSCCFLQIQLDTASSGNLYIGDSDVSATNCGANLVASQANQQFAFDSNLIILDQIYLLASAGTQQVNIIVVTR